MKYIFFLMVCCFVAGCGESDGGSPADLCKDVTCDSWESCDADSGVCVLKTGFCDTKEQCDHNQICNDQHQCVAEIIDLCAVVDCGEHSSCSVVDNKAVCSCNDGFHDESGSCVVDIVDLCAVVDCGEHSSCSVVDNKAVCSCHDGFHDEGGSCIADIVDLCKDVICEGTQICNPDNGQCVAQSVTCSDDHKTAETAVVVTSSVAVNGAVCKDQPMWYQLEITDVGSITVALTTSGDIPHIKLFDAEQKEHKSNDNDETTLEFPYISAGTYFIEVATYGNMSSFDLLVTATSMQCKKDKDCYDTYPLRSVCDDHGACIHMATDHSVPLGGFCDAHDNCSGSDVACYDIQAGVNDGENICRSTCLYNSECQGEMWCNVFHYELGLDRGFCTERCDELGGATYCKELLQYDGAVCKASGECDWKDI